MNLDYVDVFYSHRPDPETPIEETMQALDFAVRSGRALYAGISNYNAEQTQQAANILRELGTPCLIHQPKYSMFVRWTEEGLLDVLEDNGVGCIAFSPLAQGLLTDRYLKGIPENSRAAKAMAFFKNDITEEKLQQITALNNLAQEREQTLAQMAIAWLLKDKRVTSVLVGASSVEQLLQNLESINNLDFSQNELQRIEEILKTK